MLTFDENILIILIIAIEVIFVIILSSQSTDISTKPEFASRLTTYNMDDDDPLVDFFICFYSLF